MAVAAGNYHSLALKADGKVIGWGSNRWGQATSPAGLSNVLTVLGGWDYSLALRADGTVAAWGSGPVTNLPTVISILGTNALPV